MDDSQTFREELAIQYPDLGRPLWQPDPGGLYNAVQVGDVGFIRRGYFNRLFNVLSPEDNPSGEPDTECPHSLQQLQPRTSNHIRTRDPHKEFCSKGVTEVSQGSDSNMSALRPDDDSKVTFSCSGRKGALLYLPFLADQEDTVALGDFGKWIVKNIHGCMRLAEERGLGVSRMEDIILVTGRHLARSWVRAVFSESQPGRDAQASFCARVSGESDSGVVHLERRDTSGAQLTLGPNGRTSLPENQCIFIRGFHVVRVLNIWPRLRAMAEPPPDPHEPGPESETRLGLIGVPADADYRDPLHTLMEYIAEQTPACDMVLVHDDDLKCIEDSIQPLETLQSDGLMRFFRACAPKIRQFQCESPGNNSNENKSKAEVPIATVSTISQSIFEAPRDEGEIFSTSKTASRGHQPFTEKLGGLDELTTNTRLAALLGTFAIGSNTSTSAFGAGRDFSLFALIPFIRSEGFLTKMFGRRDAAFFIETLLKVDAREIHLVGNVPGWHNALMSQMPSIQGVDYAVLAPNGQPLWLLDFIPQHMCLVVPQKVWTPEKQSDWRRYVEQARIRMPVFFIQHDGTVGLPLYQALNGDRAVLHGADKAAPLGGGHTTQMRIAWPGYEPWSRQIQIRYNTRQRDEISLERFVKLVAGVIDTFFNAASTVPTQDNYWRIGNSGITRNNVIIVGTVQVSAGGWMPILQISNSNPIVAPSGPSY